jgi:hypothetical protein
VGAEPAARGELGGDAGGEQQEADREGADDPVQLHTALEHEPVEQGQDEDEHGGFGEEGATAVRGDGDEVEAGGRLIAGPVAAAGGDERKTGSGGGGGLWTQQDVGYVRICCLGAAPEGVQNIFVKHNKPL